MVNKVTLIGNLGKDPEVRTLENGTKFAKVTLATNESYKDKSGEWQTITEWHNIVLWREMAERAERQLKKGSLIYVEGKLTTRNYEQDGVTKYITEVRANTYRLLEKMGDANQNTNTENAKQNNTTPASTKTAVVEDGGSDDLPF